MEKKIILILMLFTFQAFSQKSETDVWYLKGQSIDGMVKAYLVWNEMGGHEEYLVYKKENQMDTLSFCDYFYAACPDNFILKLIQIDGKGLKEIVVTWNLQAYESNNSLTFNEIWNLDTHEKLFSAQNVFYEHYVLESVSVDIPLSDTLRDTITCSYEYDFSVENKGQITIKNTKKNFLPMNSCNQPDNEDGIYLFIDGKYCLTKKTSANAK